MWEPKLLARLDSIKRHLMTGMAPHYVVDEIECLQRDIDEEMRATSRPRDYARYKPVIQWSGEFVEIKDICLTGVPIDHYYFRGSSDDLELDLKIDETPLQFDTREYPMDAKILKTPQSSRFEGDLYRSKDGWVRQLKIAPHETYGDKHPPGVHGYTPPKSNCPEYVEGPPPTWVTSMKVSENPYYGDKPLKTFAGSDLR